MNFNLNWRVHGTFAAALLGLIVAQYVGFFLLGEGFAFGLGARAGTAIGGLNFAPKIVLGSGRFHMKAGQAVHVAYDTQVGAGCLRFYLHRFWPYSLTVFSNTADIEQSGAGATDLIAPTDGWYEMRIYQSRPGFCAGNPGSSDPLKAATMPQPGAVSFSMSWKVQPT